ncbi:hypothetical protein HYU11_00700 [Candidatus Woesearchaeota archaeon]|nr:hypothetical protein [Candidatus Woesearchaeota archaeon]
MKDEEEEYTEENHEEDIYDEEERNKLEEEEDEITPEDEGFMKGYEEGKKMAECAKCGQVLLENFVEREIKGQTYRFCSNKCAESIK